MAIRRGLVPLAHREKLAAAKAAREVADEAYRQAVADALKAGASVRNVAAETGLAVATVSRWRHERGWPTPEQQAWYSRMHVAQTPEDIEREKQWAGLSDVERAARFADWIMADDEPPAEPDQG